MHIVLLGPPLTLGSGLTVTVTLAVFTQLLPSVPVTVYTVVVVGLAVGFAQLVQDKPVEGDHEYDVAPVAAKVVDEPLHIVLLASPLTLGSGLTVTVRLAVFMQPLPSVPVTVYTVVVVGLAVGLAQLVHDNPVDGDHV